LALLPHGHRRYSTGMTQSTEERLGQVELAEMDFVVVEHRRMD
jgi:hypothetical protein